MTIEEIHDIIIQDINKQQNAYVTHEDIDRALHRAQLDQYKDYMDIIREYNHLKGASQTTSSTLHRAINSLRSFFVSEEESSSNQGVFTIPDDCEFIDSLWTQNYSDVKFLTHKEALKRHNSDIIPPTTSEPIAVMGDTTILVFPIDDIDLRLWYYKTPPTPKFAYTISNRVVTYEEGDSVQLDWNETDQNNIINRALAYLDNQLQIRKNDTTQNS